MHDRLASCPEPTHRDVGVGVAGEEQPLEHEHGRGPHRGRATEAGQDHLPHHRLDEEEEERGGEDGHGPAVHGGECTGAGVRGID